MLCMCGVGEGVGEAAGICIPGMLFIDGVGEGEALGAGDGDGIGIPCRCCARAAETTRVANTRHVSQYLKYMNFPLSD